MLTNKKGFTLIELLIVVVIIGILAAIAIPKFANTKEKAYIATMKADLRNLVTAQEAYFADNTAYGTVAMSGAACQLAGGNTYACSAGVSVTAAANAGLGWEATASHTSTLQTCQIFVGANAIPPVNEGEPICG